jgi:uridylate kinase
MSDYPVQYRRVLLKLSGEALMGELDYGIEPRVIQRIAAELASARQTGVEIAIVVGGGNIFRGAGLARAGMDRVTGDHMGMLATVMNALAIQDALEALDVHARVMSALEINAVCEDYIRTLRPVCARSRSALTFCSKQPRWMVFTTRTRPRILMRIDSTLCRMTR